MTTPALTTTTTRDTTGGRAPPAPARPQARTPTIVDRVARPATGESRVALDGQSVGGLTARYAEWTDGVGRLVATGQGPWTDTTAVFALDPNGRPTGPVDLVSSVRIVGLPVATVSSPGTSWDGISAVPAPTVSSHGQLLRVSAGAGAALEVRPGLETRAGPAGTEIVLPPALAGLGSGPLAEGIHDLAVRLLEGGPQAADPLPAQPQPQGDVPLPAPTSQPPLETPAGEAVASPGGDAALAPVPVDAAPGDEPGQPSDAAPVADDLAGATAAEPAQPVELIMPPAPTEPGPEQQSRMGRVAGGAGRAAGHARDLPPADTTTEAARSAVNEPQAEANARAASDLAAALGGAPPPSPEILQLCEDIRTAIRERRPADEDALTQADIQGAAREAGGTLNSAVQGDTQRVQGAYAPLQNTPSGTAAAGIPVTDPSPAVPDPGIGAARAAPDPVSDENLSLDADRDRVEARATESRIERHSTEPLQQTPPYSEVRANRDELANVAATGPPDVAAQQAAAITQAQTDMATLQQQALHALTSSRGGTVHGVADRQQGMVGHETQTRESVSAQAQAIFDDTQSRVQTLLEPLSRTAMARWDAEVERLSAEFRSHLNEVQRWIDDRHSGASGFVVGLWDAVTGLPGWVTREYDAAERRFGDGVCDVLLSISQDVNGVLAAARALIADARNRTKALFDGLPDDLREWADGEQQRFQQQLDGLAAETEAARTSFVTDISRKALTTVGDVQREIEDLRKKAGGLIGKIVDAIEAFIDDPIRAIINGLLSLLGIPPSSFWALVDKIAQVIDQIADDPETFGNNLVEALAMGFQGFFDRFGQHLTEAFWTWLFSRCRNVGVQLPRDASLGSIITFILQVMGITWPRIREILVAQVGARNVEIIEKVWELVSLLIQRGPAGIVEMLRDRLDPETIVNAVVEAAVEFAVQALIERVALRLLAMLNPVGAVIQAIELIYKVLRWVFENAARIFALVETVVDACAEIMAGNLAHVAQMVEGALAGLLPLVIDLLAGMIGLGDLPDQVAGVIGRLQDLVLPVVERTIIALVTQGRALLAALGLGGAAAGHGTEHGAEDDELGTTIWFTAGAESHRLWVQTTRGSAQLMVASVAGPVATKLTQWRTQVGELPDTEAEKKTQATTLLDELTPLVSTTDDEAASLEPAFEAATHDSDPETRAPSDDALEAHERRVADLLHQLFVLLESPPDYDAIINRYAPVIPGFAARRVDDLALVWARSLDGIEVGPVGNRQQLFPDALAAIAGLSGADGGAVLSDYGNQRALVPYFLLAGRQRPPDSDEFYAFVFVSTQPRPPHRVRRSFIQAVGDAAVAKIRAYVVAELPAMALSDEERTKITDALVEVTFVLSSASSAGRFTGLGTREPDHPFFKPRTVVRSGTAVHYTTESGQTFDIETDGELPRRVVGTNLTQFIGRGVTQDSPGFVADRDFNRAHVIANRFGGSGYRNAHNLVTTSAHYNQEVMAGAEKGIAKHVDDSAGALETRLRAMIPPQAAVVTFTLTVALEYVDAILRLIAQAVANSPEIPDKDATIRAGILAKLAEAHIDVKFKRVSETRYDLTALRVAGATGPELHTQIGEDTWLLSELGG